MKLINAYLAVRKVLEEYYLLKVTNGVNVINNRKYKVILFFLLCIPFLLFSEEQNVFKVDQSPDQNFLYFFKKEKINANKLLNSAESLFIEKKFKKSAKAFESFYKLYPNSNLASYTIQQHAKSLIAMEKWNEAFDVYQYCIDNYPNQIDNYNQLLNEQYNIATNVMNEKRLTLFSGGYSTPDLAIPLFEKIINNGPQWNKKPEVLFLIGKCNFDVKKYEEAIEVFKKIINLYPENELAEQSSWYQIESLKILYNKYPSSPEIQNKLLTATTIYLTIFPKSQRKNDIIVVRNNLYESKANKIFEQGNFYERVSKNDAAAIISYKLLIEKFPKSKLVNKARDRISYLESSNNS